MSRPFHNQTQQGIGSQRHMSIQPRANPNKFIDVHELLKDQMNEDSSQETNYRLYQSQAQQAQPALTPNTGQLSDQVNKANSKIPQPVQYMPTPLNRNDIGVADRYVYLNSNNKESSSKTDEGFYVYNILGLNNDVPIENIIEMEIQDFFIPNVATDATYQPVFFFQRKLNIQFESMSSQQFINGGSTGGVHFHFECLLENAGISLLATPLKKKFIFTLPIRDLSELRIKYRAAPHKDINFTEDCFDITASLTVPPPLFANRRLITASPHGLSIGLTYAVFFSGYNSINGSLNDLINDLNGHIIDVINPTTIQLTTTPGADIIGTTLTPGGVAPTGRMYVGVRTILMVVRFRSILPKLTNYIAP